MQECFARYPTVYNKSGSPDEDDEFNKDIDDAKTALMATQNSVDTVDQSEETDKTSNDKSNSPSDATKDKQ